MDPEGLLSSDLWGKTLVRDPDVVSRRIAEELFLVPVKGRLADMGNIFTLTPVAEFIWERLDGQKSVSGIRDDLLAEFDVAQEQADRDILEFVTELLDAGLVLEKEG